MYENNFKATNVNINQNLFEFLTSQVTEI